MEKILIVSDIHNKQINGVHTTLNYTIQNLISLGYDVLHLNPSLSGFKHISLPNYKEIVFVTNPKLVQKRIKYYNPDYIHIATEGPLGLSTRRFCKKNKLKYTTALHTKFDDYLYTYYRIPKFITQKYMKFFHNGAHKTLIPTKMMKEEYEKIGICNLEVWGRGVNCEMFNPRNTEIPRSSIPIFLYVGRVSKEKGIEDFLNLKFPFLVYKYVVGGGPSLEYFEKKYQHATGIKFLGPKQGKELATIYASSDVFVFPSRSDTFGIVLLEALASGLPIAAYNNEPGPQEVIEYGINGYNTDNLEYNAIQCLLLAKDKQKIADTAKKFSWLDATKTFLNNLTHV